MRPTGCPSCRLSTWQQLEPSLVPLFLQDAGFSALVRAAAKAKGLSAECQVTNMTAGEQVLPTDYSSLLAVQHGSRPLSLNPMQVAELLDQLRLMSDAKAKPSSSSGSSSSSSSSSNPSETGAEEDSAAAKEPNRGRLLSLLLGYHASTAPQRRALVEGDLCVPMLASMLPGAPVSAVAAQRGTNAMRAWHAPACICLLAHSSPAEPV